MVQVLGIDVGTTGYGLMGFNMPPTPSPPEKAIPVMKKAFEAGARFWSAAEFYGTPDYNSCHLIKAYFTKYPEDAPKVIVSLKVGMSPTRALTCDEAGIRQSYETCARVLDGTKKIDIISCARVDPDIPVEVSISAMAKLVAEGKVGAVGISECSAATLRRAAQVTKIVAVEVEYSMFTPDILSNGVAEAAAEVGAVIAAYSPLGRGLLTGAITGGDSLAQDDPKRMHPRLQGENLKTNLKLVDEVSRVAERVGATKSQVALAWTRARSGRQGMPFILPIPGSRSEDRLNENMKEIQLSEADLNELDEIIRKNPAVGDRYPPMFVKFNWG